MIRSLTIAVTLLTSTAALAQDTPRTRPALLIPMYATQIALQGADVHSTMQALKVGNRELNPLFREGVSGKMIGAKIAVSSGMIVASEVLWRRNRVAAVATMIAANAAMALVAANNYKLAQR